MLRNWLELIRVPNVFTAMADVVMGFFLVARAADFDAQSALVLGLLIGTSSLLYTAGMVLNDVFDYDEDCRDRPGRPLPSGRIAVKTAKYVGFGLLALGMGLGVAATLLVGGIGPASVATCLAGFIVLYDKIFKHTAFGPVAMGICRMLNVTLGTTATGLDVIPDDCRVIAVVIGLYVTGFSVMARGETRQGRRGVILLGILLMMAAVGAIAWLPDWRPILVEPTHWRWIVAMMAALVAWRCWQPLVDPSPAFVQQAVGQSICSLVVLDALITAVVAGLVPGVAVLSLLVPNLVLSRWFHAT